MSVESVVRLTVIQEAGENKTVGKHAFDSSPVKESDLESLIYREMPVSLYILLFILSQRENFVNRIY